MVLIHSLESVLIIVIIFMTGYWMTCAGWLNNEIGGVFSKIVLNVALPCYLFWNLVNDFSKSELIKLSGGLIVPFLSIGLSYLLAIFVSNIIKVRKERKGVFRSIFFTSNTIFIGLPINITLFGTKSLPYALLYYIANTIFFWTAGVFEISRDGLNECEKSTWFSWSTLKKTASPPLMGFILAIIFIILNIRVPAFIMDSCQYIGQLATPLGLFFIGIILYSVKFKNIRFDKDIIILILARFVICPLMVILLEHIFILPDIMAKVFIIQSAMPAMTITSVVAREYGADYEFATVVTVITTILSMLAIPVYMCLI